MKVLKDNKLRLDKNERRIGNFVIRDEDHHIKVMDINQLFTHRASKQTPVGLFLKQAFDDLTAGDERTGRGLGNWLAVIFTAFSVVPDVEWLNAAMDASEACMKRHPEAYGMRPDGTDAENDEAAREVQEMMRFEEEVKNLPDDGQAADQAGA